MNILKSLTPKAIIMNAITEKLEGTGIIKVVLVFDIHTDKYNIMLANKDNSSMKLDVSEDEITTIKKLFIRRIISAWNNKHDDEIKNIIIQIDVIKELLEIFIQTPKDKILKFDI